MEDKLLDRVLIDKLTGCWLWQRQVHKNGYPKWKVYKAEEKRQVSVWAHRFSYETFIGPIPARLTMDHLCLNKVCVNPDHLEAVTNQENVKRAKELWLKANPYFPCGHRRTDAYTVKKNGRNGKSVYRGSRCEPCTKAYSRAYLENYLPAYRERMKHAAANSLHS